MNRITPDEAALVGSLFSFGAAFGPIIASLCLDTLGRKGVLYVLTTLYFISWIILGSSTEIYVLYTGRIIGGAGVGGTFSCASIFIAEIADKNSRAIVSSINIISLSIGILIGYCVGPYTSYLTLIIVSAIPSVICFGMLFFIPESPYYLLIKDRKTEALESLLWYRGNVHSEAILQELIEMEDDIRIRKENKGNMKAIFKRGPMKAFAISYFVLFLQQATGGNAILAFSQNIFEIAHLSISSEVCSIIGGFTSLFAGLLSPYIVGRFSMKSTLIASTFGVALSFAIFVIYFFLKSSGHDVSSISFLPLVAYLMYFILSLGCTALPWPIVAELFSLELKGLASCLCGIFSSLVGFVVIQITGQLLYSAGPTIVFGTYLILNVLDAICAIFIVPNTTGLSLQEIQVFLKTGKRSIKSDDKL